MPEIDSSQFEVTEEGAIRCGDRELRPPRRLARCEVFGERLLFTVNPTADGPPDQSFPLSDPSRNAFAVSANCTREWTVELASRLRDSSDWHYQLWSHRGRPITRSKSRDHFFHVCPDSGRILDSWGSNEFKMAGKRHGLDGKVDDIREFGDITVVNVDQQIIYGFDSEGRQLWRRNDGRTWRVGETEAGPILFHQPGRGANSKFVLEPETGALTEHVFGPDDVAADVMGEPE